MKFIYSLLLATYAIAVPTEAHDGSLGYLRIPVDRYTGSSYEKRSSNDEPAFEKRDGSALMTLNNQNTYYDTVLYIGSNQQSNRVLVDTGSSDLWVQASNVSCAYSSTFSSSSRAENIEGVARPNIVDLDAMLQGMETKTNEGDLDKRAVSSALGFSAATSNSCTALGSFDVSQSDTFKYNLSAPPFYIAYADNTYSTGAWGRDTVKFGNTTISNLSFAVANVSSSNVGVLGIGLPGLEATNTGYSGYQYENLPMRLKSLGITYSNTYSLFLNKKTASTGSVLFGAVDHAKYSGTLSLLPMLKSNLFLLAPQRTQILLSGILIQSKLQNVAVSNSPVTALLDSGTTYSYLPQTMLTNFANLLGALFISTYSLYQVSCSFQNSGVNATFTFSGVNITVPISSMILPVQGQCFLTLFAMDMGGSSTPSVILGDNFLRSAYIVYDLDNYQVAMAQSVFTNNEEIEVISSTIPRATTAAGYSSTSTASRITDLTSSGNVVTSRVAGANSNYVPSSFLATFGFIASLFLL